MPIVYPPSFNALNLVPYNINPHYIEWVPEGYRGESRLDRLREYISVTRKPVVGISEGTAIQVLNGKHEILSSFPNLIVKLFLPDSKSSGFSVQSVEIGSDILPKIKPFL